MTQRREEGFALIVITALFMAFAMLAATMIDRSNATQQLDAQQFTREKTSRISMALVEYYVFHGGKYPCPAATNLAATHPSFGLSVANCETGAPAGLRLLPTNTAADAVVMGAVPLIALAPYGVMPDDAFDAWNNRIMYAVDRGTTSGGAGPSSAAARIIVRDQYTGETFRQPDFLVLSYGRDGVGAIPKAQTSVVTPCPAASTSISYNCDGDLSFFVRPILIGPSITASQSYFDDILSFYGR